MTLWMGLKPQRRENATSPMSSSCWTRASFPFKFVVMNGVPAPVEVSPDQEATNILGNKYNPPADTLALGLGEFNLNKKIKGSRKANPFPVISPINVRQLLLLSSVTRSSILRKVNKLLPFSWHE